MTTELILIRHAQKHDFEDDVPRIPGPPLTKLGLKQAQVLATYSKKLKFDRLYCSTMARAIQTTKPMLKYHKVPVSYHDQLAEINQILFFNKKKNPISWKKNSQRHKEFVQFFKKILAKKHKTICIVCHGNLINYMIGYLIKQKTNEQPRFRIANGAITNIRLDKPYISIEYVNYHAHMPKALVTH